MDVKLLKKFFGIFLAFIAICEFYSILKEYKTKRNTNNNYDEGGMK